MIIAREDALSKALEHLHQTLEATAVAHMAVFGPPGCGRTAFLEEVARRCPSDKWMSLVGEVEALSDTAIIESLESSIGNELGEEGLAVARRNPEHPLKISELAELAWRHGKNLAIFCDIGRALDKKITADDVRKLATPLRALINYQVNNPSPFILCLGCTPNVVRDARIAADVADVFRDRLPAKIWLGNAFDVPTLDAFSQIVRLQKGIDLPNATSLDRLEGITIGRLLQVLNGVPSGPLSLKHLWERLIAGTNPIVPFPPPANIVPREAFELDWPSLVLTADGLELIPALKKLVKGKVLRETQQGRAVLSEKVCEALNVRAPEYDPDRRDRAVIRLHDVDDHEVPRDLLRGLCSTVGQGASEQEVRSLGLGSCLLKFGLERNFTDRELIPPDLLPRTINLFVYLHGASRAFTDAYNDAMQDGQWVIALRGPGTESLVKQLDVRGTPTETSAMINPAVELTEADCVNLLVASDGGESDAQERESLLTRLLLGPLNQDFKRRPPLPIDDAVVKVLSALIDGAVPVNPSELATAARLKETTAKDAIKRLQAASMVTSSQKGYVEWLPDSDAVLAALMLDESNEGDALRRKLERRLLLPSSARVAPHDYLVRLYRKFATGLSSTELQRAKVRWQETAVKNRMDRLSVVIVDLLGGDDEFADELNAAFPWLSKLTSNDEGLVSLVLSQAGDDIEDRLSFLSELDVQTSRLESTRAEKWKKAREADSKKLEEATKLWDAHGSLFRKNEAAVIATSLIELRTRLNDKHTRDRNLSGDIETLQKHIHARRDLAALVKKSFDLLATRQSKLDKPLKDWDGRREANLLKDALSKQMEQCEFNEVQRQLDQFAVAVEKCQNELDQREMQIELPPEPPPRYDSPAKLKPARVTQQETDRRIQAGLPLTSAEERSSPQTASPALHPSPPLLRPASLPNGDSPQETVPPRLQVACVNRPPEPARSADGVETRVAPLIATMPISPTPATVPPPPPKSTPTSDQVTVTPTPEKQKLTWNSTEQSIDDLVRCLLSPTHHIESLDIEIVE